MRRIRLASTQSVMRLLAGAVLALVLSSVPTGAAAKDAPLVLSAADREIADGRTVRVTLAQSRIGTSVEIGRVAPNASGGGLLGALVIYSQDDREEVLTDSARLRAEALVHPLHEALAEFDVGALALAATQTALADVAWFRSRDVSMARDASSATVSPDQQAFVTYRYDLSPDFTQIRVFAEIAVRRRTRRGDSVTLMEQRLASIAQLARRSYDPRENVAAWSAEGGEPAKVALRSAFAQFEWLLAKALDLRAPEVAAFADRGREKAFAAGLYGPLVERGRNRPDDVLIWSDGLVFVQTMP